MKNKTQIKVGRKKKQCSKEEMEEKNNHADKEMHDSFIF